jgi:glutamate racemase
MMGDNRPIGILDSGLGGLTAVKAMLKALPGESFIYVGDTARVPYGEKDVDTILSYSREIIGFLQKQNVKAVIVACGTISSNAIENVREEFDLPIIDVVLPGIESCLRLCEGRGKYRIGVIATEAAIKSGFFQRKLKESKLLPEVEAMACPLLVPLIEEGWGKHVVTERIVQAYVRKWQEKPLDMLILGCTHYPLLTPLIQRSLKDTVIIDIAAAAIETTREYLAENNILAEPHKITRQFYASGDVEKFNDMAGQILGIKIEAQKVCWK